MTKIGVLIHCRNLSTIEWEEIVYGIPEKQQLGDLATLVRVILTLSPTDEVAKIITGQGPSSRDGLLEGDYTKKFFIDNLSRLEEFNILKPLIKKLNDTQRQQLRKLIENIQITDHVVNTLDETSKAAEIFNETNVDKVIQISSASHAPRCLKEEAVLRANGVIGNNQLWLSVATDVPYHDTTPSDVLVIEPLHRFDQPLTSIRPGLSELMAPYFTFNDEDKKDFMKLVGDFMTERNHLS